MAVRLPQLRLQCLGGHRATPNIFHVERVAALYSVLQTHNTSDLPLKTSLISPIAARTYAGRPVSRPKAHTGRTTTAARKAPTTSVTKAAKKPAPKKKTPKAKPKAKSKAKPRIKPKPKPAKKAKGRPKKQLTESQKKSATLKNLKATALRSPHGVPSTAWGVFCSEHLQQRKAPGMKLGSVMKELSVQFKQITPEQLEVLCIHPTRQEATANVPSTTIILLIKTRQPMPKPTANGSSPIRLSP